MTKRGTEAAGRVTWAKDVRASTRGPMLLCAGSTAVFLCGFLGWAATAPLSGAVIADGLVAAAGQNLRIQHLEGGIVSRIDAEEGDRVEAGGVLFALDTTASVAVRNRIRAQLLASMIRAERLGAERDGLDGLDFPAKLTEAAAAAGMADYLEEQRQEFEIRLLRYRQERMILEQRLLSLDRQREGLEAQKGAVEEQIAVVREERQRKSDLLDQGLTTRSEYTALLRSEADLVGQAGQYGASLLGIDVGKVEAHEQVARLDTQRLETASAELNGLRIEIGEAREQLSAAEDVLARALVRSPVGGIVVQSTFNAVGSVVRPGEVLLEILPTSDSPMVEARIPVQSIDDVRVGQDVRLAFLALNARVTPEGAGVVRYVSADRLLDPATQEPYFLARIALSDDLPANVTADQIYPGMPVQTFIETGERTFADYLTQPIRDSFQRAFRES